MEVFVIYPELSILPVFFEVSPKMNMFCFIFFFQKPCSSKILPVIRLFYLAAVFYGLPEYAVFIAYRHPVACHSL